MFLDSQKTWRKKGFYYFSCRKLDETFILRHSSCIWYMMSFTIIFKHAYLVKFVLCVCEELSIAEYTRMPVH